MKSKLNYLIGISLKRKVKTKWFLVANIILAVIIMGVTNIDSIITFFGGDFNEKQNIYVIDNTNDNTFEIFKNQVKETGNLSGDDTKYEVKKYDKDLDSAKKMLEDEKKSNMLVVFNDDAELVLDATIITKEYMDIIDTQLINNAINSTKTVLAISHSNITEAELNKLLNPINIKREYLDEDKNSTDENMEMIMTTVFPVIILPFFMLSIFLVQMIGAEVNDEKTTKGMEIIISNVSPKTHFFSKVIAGNLFVILQGVLLFAYLGLGLLIRKLIGGANIANGMGDEVITVISQLLSSDIGSKLSYIIPMVLLLMLLTFIGYSLLAGILASMTTNIEDFQQLQTPIMILSLVGYYLSMMAGMFNGALFIKIFAFIPFISAILAPSLLVLGQFSIVEFIISTLIMILTNYLLIKYGLKIYKVGILNYSSKDLWKKMFKALKSK
ncbi:MAG: ABC transporter permease [Bacilli bacterium]